MHAYALVMTCFNGLVLATSLIRLGDNKQPAALMDIILYGALLAWGCAVL